ncbi:MAG: hypothetical protein KDI36_10705 [Pseudomonadales bacterium]|nr:hypothetical protein [Pseudomonadales bacterium]
MRPGQVCDSDLIHLKVSNSALTYNADHILLMVVSEMSSQGVQCQQAGLKGQLSCLGMIVGPHFPCIALMLLAPWVGLAASYVSNFLLVSVLTLIGGATSFHCWYREKPPFTGQRQRYWVPATIVVVCAAMLLAHMPGLGLHHHELVDPAHFDELSRTLDCIS